MTLPRSVTRRQFVRVSTGASAALFGSAVPIATAGSSRKQKGTPSAGFWSDARRRIRRATARYPMQLAEKTTWAQAPKQCRRPSPKLEATNDE